MDEDWTGGSFGTLDQFEPIRLYRDRTSAEGIARRLAAVRREILLWRLAALTCLIGFNIAVALILKDLMHFN